MRSRRPYISVTVRFLRPRTRLLYLNNTQNGIIPKYDDARRCTKHPPPSHTSRTPLWAQFRYSAAPMAGNYMQVRTSQASVPVLCYILYSAQFATPEFVFLHSRLRSRFNAPVYHLNNPQHFPLLSSPSYNNVLFKFEYRNLCLPIFLYFFMVHVGMLIIIWVHITKQKRSKKRNL